MLFMLLCGRLVWWVLVVLIWVRCRCVWFYWWNWVISVLCCCLLNVVNVGLVVVVSVSIVRWNV